jgi:lipid II:glycine glycyltransferase (peptidoglycan interpeptide bridge formation enzyme)
MTTLRHCNNREEWDDYALENNCHPLQLWGWGDVKSANGWKAERLQLLDNDKVVGAAQVLIRRLPRPLKSLAYIPRGPITNEENRIELLQKLTEYVKKTYHSVALMIEPDSVEYSVPKSWKKSTNHILPSRTVILNLNRSESELLNDMSKKTRQYIRKSASEAMAIKMVRSREELDKCLNIYHSTAKRAKFDIHTDQYYYDIFFSMSDNSQLFAAYVDSQPVAFLWLAISADTAFELFGGMDETGQQLRLNYALKWHAILKCKEWGLTRYDFGGMIDGGVKTFKMGWTSNETELAGTFDRPLSTFYPVWSGVMPTAKKVVRRAKKLIRR